MRHLLSAFLISATMLAGAQPVQLDTKGKEFWLGFMQNASGTQQLSVRIAADQATSGTVSVPLAGWSTNFSVAANGVATVSVPNIHEVIGSETVQDRGVYITSVEPVTVTLVNYQNQTTDATMVLPVTGLGTSYRVDALPGTSTAYQNGSYIFRSEFLIVATEDGTEVTITPTATTTTGHVPGIPFTVALNAGQTYQVQAFSGLTDLTGTTVVATEQSGPCRPFAVFGGSMCAVVECAACDHVNEQMIPVNTWGTSFHTVPLGNLAAWSYRVMANENNTVVTIDGGAPVVLNAGAVHTVSNVNAPACIASDKPVSVTQIMQGATCTGSGDPSLLLLTADDRMSTSAGFTTLFSTQSAIAHYVSVVVPTASISQLQLDGNPVSPSSFSTYAGCSGFSHAKLLIGAGSHRLSSPAGFLAYAYGLASGESYLYAISDRMAPPDPPAPVICSSDPITLTSPVNLSNAQWTMASDPGIVLANGNSYTFTPDHNDVYRVEGELMPSGCVKSYEFQVGLPVNPDLDLTADGQSTTTVCQFSAVQLGVGSIPNADWFDLNWSPSAQMSDPAIPDPVAYPDTDTWFKLMVTSPVGCGSAVDSVFVQVQPSTIYSLRTTVDNDSICAGNSTALRAEVERVLFADAFEGTPATWWQSIQGGTPSADCGSVTGTALYFNGASVRSATTPPINLNDGGMVHFALKIAAGTAPCDDADPGEDVVLEYSLNGSSWQVLATFNEADYPAFTQLDVSLPALGPAGNAVQLRWRQPLHSGAGQDNWSMDNVLITRYEAASGQLTWTPSGTLVNPTSATPTATPTGDTWYKAKVTNNSGCIYADSVLVRVAPAFALQPMADTVRCGTAGIPLQAQATSGTGITWNWSPANGLSATNIPDPVASPQSTTTYTVAATNSWGCSANGQVMVSVSQLNAISVAAAETALCYGGTVDLSATISSTGAYGMAWTPANVVANPNAASTSAMPVTTTEFIGTATDFATGCTMEASVVVEVSPEYVIDLPGDTTVCSALGLQLNLGHNMAPPYQVSWQPAANLNAANIPSPTILVDHSDTYTVTLTDAHGCSVSESISVTVAFESLVTPVNLTACAGETLVLDAGFPGSTYSWSNNTTAQTISVGQSGQYVVTLTDANLCQVIKTFNVVFNPLPVVDLGSDLSLCGATSQVLDAGNAGSTILWSTGATTPQVTVNTTGLYSVNVTDSNGCQATDELHVTFNDLPVDNLQDVTSCESTLVSLDAGNPGSTFLWNTGSTGQSITPATSGSYAVTVTTPENCTAVFAAEVTYMPRVSVSLGTDQELCEGELVELDAGDSADNSFQWNTGGTTPTLTVSQSGTYSVFVTNGYCSDADTVTVLFHPAPINTIGNQTACVGDPIVFNAGNPGSTFAWSTNETGPSITVNTPGVYNVQVTSDHGCEALFSATATFVPRPVVDLGPDTVLCAGQLLVLDAGNPGNNYAWSTGAGSPLITVATGGSYSVEVDNGYCSVSDAVTVIFNPAPDPVPTHLVYTCLDEDPHYVELDAGNPGSTFLWDDGKHTQRIRAMSYGWKTVAITNVYGCVRMDSIMVEEFCGPTIFIPNTFTPNGDGRNDTWTAVGNNIVFYEMLVFDRWGGIVFRSNSINDAWDGTSNGQPVANDVYAFRVTYRLQEDSSGRIGFEQTKLGHVQVLR